ncbi:hypothetical protein TrVE_jg4985 [Triparma verrucosa]|uniref:Uncharacterized protein n=1 Tax=Triparma verrucosa TaxID=1606542 RepID=A0A9W7CN43_9STRA|nr:hypothetical protein TrVE_jg4985 [Triparma verrucosa]
MSKRTSGDLANAIEILDPNSLESVDDEEEVFDGSELDSAADETPAIGGDDFMHTDDFRRLFVGFFMVNTLVSMRWLDRKWHKVVEKKLTDFEDEPFGKIDYSSDDDDEPSGGLIVHGENCFKLGGLIVHGGNDLSYDEAMSDARVPSDIDVSYNDDDVTSEVVAYLRSIQ